MEKYVENITEIKEDNICTQGSWFEVFMLFDETKLLI